MSQREQIGVRVDPEFRARVRAEAERNFGGNESLVLRKGTDLYLRLREKLGVQFEPMLAIWLGDDDQNRTAA